MSNYSELLKDPKWQRKRLAIFKRDKWTCCFCGDTEKTLHVHHLKYEHGKKPWEYPNRYLLTLCETCHEEERTDRKTYENDLLSMLRQEGFSCDNILTLASAFNHENRDFPTTKHEKEMIAEIARFIDHFRYCSVIDLAAEPTRGNKKLVIVIEEDNKK